MIRSVAPTRIDLAGSTLDIWPLFLMFGNPPTLNAAIDLYASVELYPSKEKTIAVESIDQKIKATFSSIDAIPDKHPLELILKTVQFYRPNSGVKIITDCQAPAGSGIGGSSALAVALNGAFNRLTQRKFKKFQLIEIGKNIETQVISVPTGWQDYFPALYGGVLSIEPNLIQVGSRAIPLNLKDLSDRFVLCYTGKPRQSGINNWEVFKGALDGKKPILNKFERISQIARELRESLLQGQLEALIPAFNEEWKIRKALAPGISTPQIEHLVSAAKKQGALAAKICGAGGGGCVAFFVQKDKKKTVSQTLKNLGASVLDFRFVNQGLKVKKF